MVWQLLSFVVSPAILASPVATAKALGELAWGSKLWVELLVLKRMIIGLAIRQPSAGCWAWWPGYSRGYARFWSRCAGCR